MLQARPPRPWCASNRSAAFFDARPADGSTGRSPALPSPWPAGPSGPIRAGRAGPSAAVSAVSSSSSSNRPFCPLRRSAAAAAPACKARSTTANHCERRPPSESKAPALTSDSMAVRLTWPGSSRSQKSNRLRNGPVRLAGLDDRRRGRAAAALDGRQAEVDLALAHGEIAVASGSRRAARPRCPSAGNLPGARPASPSS